MAFLLLSAFALAPLAHAQPSAPEAPEGDSAESAAPEETAPEAGSEEETASEEAAPEEAAPGEAAPGEPEEAATEEAAEEGATEETGAEPREAPKVAVVVSGDPDDRMRTLARRVDGALEPALRRPFDPGLRAALRGDPGQADDGFDGVRRDRRRLGSSEAEDAPVVSRLGRRAGALVVAVARAGEDGPELVVVDVRHGAFYEGTLPLSSSTPEARIVEFIGRRARASLRRAHVAPEAVAEVEGAAEDEPEPETPEEPGEPDFFEQYWPYMVAAVLLAAMITAIVATSVSDAPAQPVLRFVPGGR